MSNLKFFIFLILPLLTLCEYTGRFNDYKNHSCIRDCNLSQESRICEYNWSLEIYSTLSRACYKCPNEYSDCLRENCVLGDGVLKMIETVNRMIPGPAIQVCKGDTIIVNVENSLRSERVTSIHWHGIKQKNSPYMDGVGMVTQCPIIPHTSFQYKFIADDAGTHFWHAHSGVQRADGVFGALVVRESNTTDLNSNLYDFDLPEHYLILIEWSKMTFQLNYGPYMHSGNFLPQHTILINGKGKITDQPNLNVPLETYKVKKGFRYRFRLINSGIEYCIMQLSIDGHNLTVIASDGEPIEPIEVESLTSSPGERYDFVLKTNQEPKDYWIKIRGEGQCQFTELSQVAILRYETGLAKNYLNSTIKLSYQDSFRDGLQLRSVPHTFDKQNFKKIDDLKHPKNLKQEYFDRLAQKPDKKIYLNMDGEENDDPEFHQELLYPFNNSLNKWKTSVVDNIKFEMPSLVPIHDWNDIPKEMFCNKTHRKHKCPDMTKMCTCVHLLEFDLNDLVEVILIDGNVMLNPHVAHLHGHNFAILGIDTLNVTGRNKLTSEHVEELDRQNLLKRNFDRPIIKDTVSFPTGGYAIIRFIASNPGFWMFHCHLESHADSGMMLLIKVGEFSDLPKKPNNMPTCGLNKRASSDTNAAKKLHLRIILFFLALLSIRF